MTDQTQPKTNPKITLLHRTSSVVIVEPDHGGGFSQVVAICFTINYLVGTGFLCLPFAFYTGGTILSTITLAAVLFFSNITKNYVLEAMARAEAMHDDDARHNADNGKRDLFLASTESSHSSRQYGTISAAATDEIKRTDEESQGSASATLSLYEEELYLLDASMGNSAPSLQRGKEESDKMYCVRDIKFEYTELVHMFLGKLAERIYIFSVSLTQFLTLWGFTAVFSSAVAVQFPIIHDYVADYNLYVLVYAAVVIPLSCLNLNEQVLFQLILSAFRFVLIFVMIYTVLRATHDADDVTYFVSQKEPEGTEHVRLQGFYSMFSILVYAALFHNGIPVLSEPVANKKKLGGMFRTTLVLCSVLFWTLGYFIASFFGHNVEQSTNLNWKDYVGGTGRPKDDNNWNAGWEDTALWADALSLFVVAFPALNVVSSFPLNAIVLGNNLMAAVQGEDVHEHETNVKCRVIFRLLSSVPPIIGSTFVRELGVITSYAGIFAIATAFVFPPLLYIQSIAITERRGLKRRTCYEGVGSSKAWATFVCILSSVAVFYVLICLIISG